MSVKSTMRTHEDRFRRDTARCPSQRPELHSGSISLHPHITLGRRPLRQPEPPSLFPAGPPSRRTLLLLVWKGLPGWRQVPMDEDESAEDEECSSPPQDLLALSIQHKTQEGLQDRDSCEAARHVPAGPDHVGGPTSLSCGRLPSQGGRKGLEPQIRLKPSCHLQQLTRLIWVSPGEAGRAPRS